MPLCAFYWLATVAIVLREVQPFILFAPNTAVLTYWINFVQPIAKLSTGNIQAWIILEVALMVRESIILDKDQAAERSKSLKMIKIG